MGIARLSTRGDAMGNWQDRLKRISKPAASEREVLESIETTAAMLGFDMGNRSMTFSASQLWSEASAAGPVPRSVGGGLHPGHARWAPTLRPVANPAGQRQAWPSRNSHALVRLRGSSRAGPATHGAPHRARTVALTERELEVLKLTAQGKTSSEIAALLMVSGNTVNFHIRNAMLKLQARNKTAAAVCAALQGWLNG